MYRFCKLATFAVLLCMFSSASICCGYQAAGDTMKSGGDSQRQITVYRMQFVPAKEANSMILQLLGGKESESFQTCVDIRTNSLILSGTPAAHAEISEVLKVIDVRTVEPNEKATEGRVVKSFPWGGGLDAETFSKMISSALAERKNVHVEVLEKLGVVLMKGSQDDVKMVETLIGEVKDLAVANPRGIKTSAYVSFTFLVEGNAFPNEFGKAPNEALTRIIDKATKMELLHMESPRIATTVVNRVVMDANEPERSNFANKSTSSNGIMMETSGGIRQAGDIFELNSQIELLIDTDGPKGSSVLRTNVDLPLDHPVMLSISTINGLESVVLVQVHSAD